MSEKDYVDLPVVLTVMVGVPNPAHITDIFEDPRCAPFVRQTCQEIMDRSWGTLKQFEDIRKEWIRLGRPKARRNGTQGVL